MIRFPIICSGGIGDTFVRLTEVPIAAWGTLGMRFHIFYEGREHPAWKIMQELLQSLRYCRFADRAPTLAEYRVRNVWKRMARRSNSLYAPPLPAGKERKSNLSGKRRILLQSHLDGHHGHTNLSAKKWPVERWCALADLFERDGWAVELLEYDATAFTAISKACPFVRDARRSSLLETIQNMRHVQCVVSVDSWTKYVAGWWKIPQVVIVPDLRKGYTPAFERMTADKLAHTWFRGLTNSSKTSLIGLEKRNGVYEYTLPSMDVLTVDELETAVASVVTK